MKNKVEASDEIEEFTFGKIRIDGKDYERDVIIDRGKVSKRKKKASKVYRDQFWPHAIA